MPELPPPPEHIDEDTVQYIDQLISDPDAAGHMRTRTALKAMMTTPKTMFQKALRHDLTSNPSKMEEVIKKTTPEDFRAFLRDEILDKEKQNISGSLADLRKVDPEAYNKALQGWAKIALPSQKETNINVDIRQKADMYSRIQQQYGLSQMIEDVEPLPEPTEEEQPQSEPEPVLAENQPKVVRPYDFRAAVDPTFFDTETIEAEEKPHDYDPIENPTIDEQEAEEEDLPY